MAIAGWIVALVAVGVAVGLAIAAARQRERLVDSGHADREAEQLRQLADQAQQAEAQLRRSLDAIPQGVVIGDQDGTVTSRNSAAADFVAARHGEALVEAAIR